MILKKIIFTVVLLLLCNLSSFADQNQIQDSVKFQPQELQLPENVKAVLKYEMSTITRLMGYLLEYIVQGDAVNTSSVALEIRDTNLKQEFNSQEIKRIMKILPKKFIKLDRKFHSTANELSKAADTNDFKAAIRLYTEMAQGCYNCHTAFANDRFENLKPEDEN